MEHIVRSKIVKLSINLKYILLLIFLFIRFLVEKRLSVNNFPEQRPLVT